MHLLILAADPIDAGTLRDTIGDEIDGARVHNVCGEAGRRFDVPVTLARL